eukprot:548029-Pyramimonas_sp.AAC.1
MALANHQARSRATFWSQTSNRNGGLAKPSARRKPLRRETGRARERERETGKGTRGRGSESNGRE